MSISQQHHLHHHYQQQQQQPPPHLFRNLLSVDPQINGPISFFTPDQSIPPCPPPWLAEDPRKKGLEEQEFLENNSQVSSVVDFLHQHQSAAAAAATRSVSTGLGLSFDDNRHGGVSYAPLSVAGAAVDSPLFPSIDEDIDRELQRQDAEMDRFIRLQGERLRQVILEKIQAKQLQTLSTVERKILQKLREKEAELEDINKKNTELEERMKQLSIEAGAWQHRAKCSENMIAQLKINLQQVFTQGRDSKEGCGDSEVDDTASCCNGGGAVDFQLVFRENKNIKESLICKVCRLNEVCMLLLPCRHLCICKECESKLSFCPLCQSSKFIGMEIYM
ncbi:hypothetical protein QJS04_geneDACA018589 [Acorus gramineus]|uniref:RING-type domain-containing protein n=1 Tax=Acorus gramineus TaxID=55184 RepID=A0AAV9AGN1_ACOGR|nr:hypothetical protein QJS04_geneDACA018589 [Acorus gramineus]